MERETVNKIANSISIAGILFGLGMATVGGWVGVVGYVAGIVCTGDLIIRNFIPLLSEA